MAPPPTTVKQSVTPFLIKKSTIRIMDDFPSEKIPDDVLGLRKEEEDLLNGTGAEPITKPTTSEKYGLRFKIASIDRNTGLLTLHIMGKVRNEDFDSIIDILSNYPRDINKILTNDSNADGYDVLIELEIENTELQTIRSLLNEFS